MNGAERISLWLAQVRATGQGMRVLRLVIALVGAVALVVPSAQPWDQADVVPLLGVPLLLTAVLLPDSLAGMLFLLVVAAGWLFRGPAEVSVGLAVTAMALLLFHLISAFAAQLPSYVQLAPNAYRRWLLPTAIFLLITAVVAVATAVVQNADVPGSLLVTVAALGLATAVTWFAAARE